MTYLSQELSHDDGEVFELYEFATDTKLWKYTTYDQTTAEGFEPLEIGREKLQRVDNLLKQDLNVSVPQDSVFGAEIFSSVPEETMTIKVFTQHNGSDETALLFIGRLVNVEVKKHKVIMKFEPISTTLKRSGFQAQYQRFCRHTIYGLFCGANPLEHTVTGLVTSILKDEITIEQVTGFAPNYFTAGYIVTSGGLKRMVIKHTNNTLSLIRPIPTLTVGTEITVYAGCDHTFSTCKTKFENELNYGGFEHIPSSNPFAGLTVF